MAIIILFLLSIGGVLVMALRQRRWPQLRRLAGGLLVSYASVVLLLA